MKKTHATRLLAGQKEIDLESLSQRNTLRLDNAIERVREAIDSRLNASDDESILSCDIDNCLAVRNAATLFVDYVGWAKAVDEEVDEQRFRILAKLMVDAENSMVESVHENAIKFRTSVRNKLDVITQVMNSFESEPADAACEVFPR